MVNFGLRSFKAFVLPVQVVCLLMLSGCGDNILYRETFKNENKKIVRSEKIERVWNTERLDDDTIDSVVRHYKDHGRGKVEIFVTYDPDVGGASRSATNDVARLASAFRYKNREAHIVTKIMPVQDSASKTIIQYESLTAHAPEGCENNLMTMKDVDAQQYKDYMIGCTHDSLIARQVAEPEDLLGTDVSDPADARRAANHVDLYREGNLPPIAGASSGD